MYSVKIIPSYLQGKVRIPSSKSLSHRAVIAAGLCEGISYIRNVTMSEDIEATCEVMKNLGVSIIQHGDRLEIKGGKHVELLQPDLNCGESGSTLRFIIPISMLAEKMVTFHGKGRLVERPLTPYFEIFETEKIKYTTQAGSLPLTVEGGLKAGDFHLRGDISSQFITGLLFTLPLLPGDSTIHITTELESKGYVNLTLDILKQFGIHVENDKYKSFFIPGNQQYFAKDYTVEGDFSQAAFFAVASALGSQVTCIGLPENSLQGDRVILDILQSMNAKVTWEENGVNVASAELKGTVIDASQCPDLVPILAVLGSLAEGTTEIIHAERVRLKESDRLKAITEELNKIGAEVYERADGLLIKGKKQLKGGVVEGWNDHRIVMALAIASTRCSEPLIIRGSSAINKSYPAFLKDFISIGGKLDEWSMG